LPASEGEPFGFQARFPAEHVRIKGRYNDYVRISDHGEERVFSFCPSAAPRSSTTPSGPELVAVPVAAFADPSFPAPTVSVYESRRHPWVELPEGVAREE
jgi:hypothetical protein